MKKRKIIIFLLVLFSFFSSSFARNDGNCNLGNLKYFDELGSTNIFSANQIITKDVYNKALENLKRYCDDDSDVLSSPILLNHILDISFRKLDGIKGLAYGVKLDPQAVMWRNYINQISQQFETDPKEIYKNFKDIWGTADKNLEANSETLYGKYLLACDELAVIADKLNSYSTKDNRNLSVYNSYLLPACENLAKDRYKKETALVLMLNINTISHHLKKELNKGLNKTFLEQNGKLIDKFMILGGNYEYMVRRFIHATDVNTR